MHVNFQSLQPKLILVLLLALITVAPRAFASQIQEEGQRIHFQISEQMSGENDSLRIDFAAIQEGDSSLSVITQINQQMQQALNALKKLKLPASKMVATSGNYSVSPTYNKQGQIQHWRGRQSLNIQITDLAQASKVMNALQDYLSYQNMQFTLSESKRQELNQQLLIKALQTYQARAKLIAEQFAAKKYHLTETHINQNRSPMPVARNMAYETVAMSVAPVATSSGNSLLNITIRGTLFIPDAQQMQ